MNRREGNPFYKDNQVVSVLNGLIHDEEQKTNKQRNLAPMHEKCTFIQKAVMVGVGGLGLGVGMISVMVLI